MRRKNLFCGIAIALLILVPAFARALDPNPPDHAVKLIFIHHSTGENWLTDDYGNLGITLGSNNYFVSDTNYGWGPNNIGDRTDIPNWIEWFSSVDTPTYMDALFHESGQHSGYTRTLSDPGGENEIVMFKSCFPNSDLEGNPDDPPDPGNPGLNVSYAKYVYNTILGYFGSHPEKLFVVITAPPLLDAHTTSEHAANARAFNDWLYNDWLASNGYSGTNVAVFDFYNVLTHADAHNMYDSGSDTIIHVATSQNTSYYPSSAEDDHPNPEGSQKATGEFVPLLNIFYHLWKPYSISPQSVTIPREGGSGDVLVTACTGCSWSVVANDSWLHCTAGCSGTGNGTFSYSVDANPDAGARTGTMTIGQLTFTIDQNGLCLFCDDFEDGVRAADWWYIKGNWWESGGHLQGEAARKAIAVAQPAFGGCDLCTVDATMQTAGGTGNRVWLLGWYQDKANTIELMMKQETGRWVLKQRVNGTVVRKTKAVSFIAPGTDYEVGISFDGAALNVTIDGASAITMPVAENTWPWGTVGFQSKGTTGSFDAINVN